MILLGTILHDRFVVWLDARGLKLLQVPTPRISKTLPECEPAVGVGRPAGRRTPARAGHWSLSVPTSIKRRL